MVPDLGAVILDRAARPLVEPEIRGVDPELTSDEDDDVVRYLPNVREGTGRGGRWIC